MKSVIETWTSSRTLAEAARKAGVSAGEAVAAALEHQIKRRGQLPPIRPGRARLNRMQRIFFSLFLAGHVGRAPEAFSRQGRLSFFRAVWTAGGDLAMLMDRTEMTPAQAIMTARQLYEDAELIEARVPLPRLRPGRVRLTEAERCLLDVLNGHRRKEGA